MFEGLLIKIAMGLRDAHLPYMIIGGQAVLLYGTPRMTKDIDITLGAGIDDLDKIVDAVEAIDLQIIPRDFRSFVEKTFVLPTKDEETQIRVDFILSFTPYERQAIGRAKPILLGETPVMFASVEDVIIHKVFAGRARDLEDVRSMSIKNPDLDRAYVRRWLKEFDRSTEKTGLLKSFEDTVQGKES
jgi:hypothetical protein